MVSTDNGHRQGHVVHEVPDRAVFDPHDVRPQIPLGVIQKRVMQYDNPLVRFAQLFKHVPGPFVRHRDVHIKEDQSVVVLPHLPRIRNEIPQRLRIKVDIRHRSKDSVETGHVKEVSPGNDGGLYSVTFRKTLCGHFLFPRLS